MENLVINAVKTKPSIDFDANNGKLLIEGESYPENALEFYKPIYNWIENYLESVDKTKEVEVVFKMTYFNTSSSKAILDIFDLLEAGHKKGCNIMVSWFYEEDDEDIQESGEEFGEGLTLNYQLISYKD